MPCACLKACNQIPRAPLAITAHASALLGPAEAMIPLPEERL